MTATGRMRRGGACGSGIDFLGVAGAGAGDSIAFSAPSWVLILTPLSEEQMLLLLLVQCTLGGELTISDFTDDESW